MKSHRAVSRRRLRVGAALLVILAGGVWFLYWTEIEHRFYVVTEGRVYQSGAIPQADFADVVGEHGIKTVIDLRIEPRSDIDAERQTLTALGVRYVNLPTGHIPRPETVDAFLAIAGRPENQPVLIHCWHGEGRSVLFGAIYRIEFEGWDNDRARRACRLFPWRGTFRPEGAKGRYLLAYRPRRR